MDEKKQKIEQKPPVRRKHNLGGILLIFFAVVFIVVVTVVALNYTEVTNLIEKCSTICYVGECCGGFNYPQAPECREFKIKIDSPQSISEDMCLEEFEKQGLPSREVAEKMGLEYVCRECSIARVELTNISGNTIADVTCSCSYGKCK